MTTQEERIEFAIEGMDCATCAMGIERHLKKNGFIKPSVSFATASAKVSLPQGKSSRDAQSTIEELGYKVKGSISASSAPRYQVSRALIIKLIVCVVLTAPLLLHMFSSNHLLHDPIFQLLLSTPVYFIGLHHFGRSALGSIRAGLPNMDLLIVIGTTAAYVYSLVGLIFNLGPEFQFFETAASITTLVLVGNFIEQRAVHRTSNAIVELAKVQPTKAKKLIHVDGQRSVQEIDAGSIVTGDLLQVNTGDKIPTDGIVVSGHAEIDESMITGESVPVSRSSSSPVIGGTIVVDGNLTIEASAVGDNTVLAGIIRLVKQAHDTKPQIQRLGDMVSAYFTPIVLCIAILTLIISLFFGISFGAALLRSVAVLVIACPCAMGLATPTAVMVGVGRGAKSGILVRGGDVLEKLSQVKHIVLDKTGTLTTGEFKIDNFHVISGDKERAQGLVLALEKNSSHPIAKSLVRELAASPLVTLSDMNEMRGQGMRGVSAEGKEIRLIAARKSSSSLIPKDASLVLEENGEAIAAITIADALRPGAVNAIVELKAAGLTPVILSGDTAEKCDLVAKELGIDLVYAEQSPENKLQVIDELQRGGVVALVGDGINDAPALSKASVGISLGNATQSAIHAADIVLMRDDLRLLPEAYKLSRHTLLTIKQNLFWAFSYNILAIPMAALGFLTPLLAAIAMGFSDVMTIGNSLRLKVKSIDKL